MATRRADLQDAALAALLAAFGVIGTTFAGARPFPGAEAVDVWAYALVLVAAASLVVRRRWPIVTLAVAVTATSAYLVLGYPYGPILISAMVAVYSTARHRPLRRAASAAAVALAVLLAHLFVGADGDSPGFVGVIPGSAWVVVPFAVGVMVRLTREAAAQSQADLARRHANEERLRVAQEVHDVVGHGLAAINMQAEIALHLLPTRPEQAEGALSAISRTSSEALEELRSTLAVVRKSDGRDGRAPAPGLAGLDGLVARMSESGLVVRVEGSVPSPSLPPLVDLTAYRIIQESLTNVLRHADAGVATIRISHDRSDVVVEVADDGRGAPAPTVADGHGIPGMRERAAALGGSLAVGPADGGGFRVRARLPLEGHA